MAGANSLTGNPAFAGPATDNYMLTTSSSAAINKALDLGVPDDFEGDTRPQVTILDIGYDESPFEPLKYVFLPVIIK